jgi:hypothetical protein
VLCILLGMLYAVLLYYRERKNEFPIYLKWILGISRMLTVSLIAFFLIGPLIKTQQKFTEEPLIIFAQDNSESIISGKDSSYYLNTYRENLKQLVSSLEQEYSVKKYAFGDGVSADFIIDFEDKITDFSGLFNEIDQRLSGRNIGAMIIASDGLYNQGINPLYASLNTFFPVYTVALGDTAVYKDLIISKINYNRLAYQGNEFPIEVMINAKMCLNQSSRLSIFHEGKEVKSSNLDFKSRNDFQSIRFNIEAKKKGMQRFRILLNKIDGEVNTENNVQDIFIEILDGKQKILILANSPHPDVSAIKQGLSSNINYEVEDFIFSKFDKNIAPYNLVIFHNLPSAKYFLDDIFAEMKEEKIPALYIVGGQTNLNALKKQNPGFSINEGNLIYNDVQSTFNPSFTIFSLPENSQREISNFPPLVSPYGSINVSPAAHTLFFQRMGSLKTKDPLFLFYQNEDTKNASILGEGIWRWRISNYKTSNNHLIFDDLVNRMVQYLSVKADKSQFRIFHKNNFNENQNVEIEAELYNESYDLINDPEVNITFTNSDGKRFPFTFSRTANSYFLNAGKLPVDNYSWSARVVWGGKTFTDEGLFSITALNIENTKTIANHNLLFNLAQKRGGEMLYPDEMQSLLQKIKDTEDIASITYSRKKFSELLNLEWILILILGLLSLEWFLRKRAGSY